MSKKHGASIRILLYSCSDGGGQSPGSCKKKATEASVEESSLRSSYETATTNFSRHLSENPPSSPAQQALQAIRAFVPNSSADAAFSAGSTAVKASILKAREQVALDQQQGQDIAVMEAFGVQSRYSL